MIKNKPNKIIFSFFAGAGFLDLGFEKEGYKIKFANESHKPFLDAYKRSRNKMGTKNVDITYHNDDIAKLINTKAKNIITEMIKTEKDDSSLIGFIGGPPCPDFSVGGKNKGINGRNGILSKVYFKIIIQQRPDFFLFENVKGLWRTKKHREFYEKMKKMVKNSGYIITEKLVNAIEYGAPQDRERIIMVGVKQNIAKRNKLKYSKNEFREGEFPWMKYSKISKEKIFKYNWPTINRYNSDKKRYRPKGIKQEFTIQHWFNKNKVNSHPNSEHYFKPKAENRFMKIDEGDVSKKSFKRLHRWRYSPTACYGNNEVHLHPYKPRRMSVAEVLAIQTLPKEFVLPGNMTLSNMFKSVGNGVPFVLSRAIAKTINDVID